MHSIIIPFSLSLICIAMAFRPYLRTSDYDFGVVFRLFWVVPFLLVWLTYLIVLNGGIM